jgi:hypothetical protein
VPNPEQPDTRPEPLARAPRRGALKAADFRIADTLVGVTAVPTPQATSHWHHFVPKRQIRRWAHDRVDDPDRALVHLRPKRGGDVRPVSVKKAFAQTDHHLIRMLDGTDSSWIDQQLLQPLEGTMPGVFSSLVDGSETLMSIGVDRKNMALFVNLLHQAVPAKVERRAQDALADPAEAAAFAYWMAGHTGAPSDPRARREFAMGRALQVVLGSGQAAAIAERAWQLFRVPATIAETLILGDVPVLEVQFSASDGRDYPLLAFPLDPRTLLVLYPYTGEDEPDAQLTADDVGAVNRVTWGEAQHAAVGRHEHDLDLARLAPAGGLPLVILGVPARARPEAFAT